MTTSGKARKQFIPDQNKIRKAKKILGADTETETVDRALKRLPFDSSQP